MATLEQLSKQAGVDPVAVTAEQEKFSGLTTEAAIGNVAGRQEVSGIFTDNAIDTVNNQKTTLDTIAPVITPENFPTTSKKNAQGEIINPTQEDVKRFNEQFTTEKAPGTQFSFEEASALFGGDFTGLTQNPDGSFSADTSALQRLGIQGAQGQELHDDLEEVEGQIEQLVNEFGTFNIDQDPAFQSQANQIRSQFDRLRNEMEQINKSRAATIRTIGARTGATQFAGQIQLGVEGEELKQAGQRMADIAREEAAAIVGARQAFENNEFARFSQQVNALQVLRNQKADELNRYNDALAAAANSIRDQAEEARKQQKQIFDQAIALEKFGFDKQKFFIGEERAQRTAQLDEAKFQFDLDEFQITQTLDRILEAAASGFQLEQFSESDRTALERAANLIPGSFEAIFSKAFDQAQRGDFMDALEIQQLQAALQRTRGLTAATASTEARAAREEQRLIDRLSGVDEAGQPIIDPVTGKPPTATQFKVAGFASRILQAGNIIDDLEDDVIALPITQFAISQFLPSIAKPDVVRQIDQAQRNFVNAILRRESGAAISPGEFNSAEKQYFPKPGDDSNTLIQKRANRDLILQNLMNEAGAAFVPNPLTDLPVTTGNQTQNDGLSDEDAFQQYLQIIGQ